MRSKTGIRRIAYNKNGTSKKYRRRSLCVGYGQDSHIGDDGVRLYLSERAQASAVEDTPGVPEQHVPSLNDPFGPAQCAASVLVHPP